MAGDNATALRAASHGVAGDNATAHRAASHRAARHGAAMTIFSRREQLGRVASTQDIVRGWLAAGIPEVCLAVADEQTAGRGRAGRDWLAPAGAALLCSLGFRPTWLDPGGAWRLAAVTALAMADAAEDVAGLSVGAIRCKWPNDLVVERRGEAARAVGDAMADRRADPGLPAAAGTPARKLAGILGETDGLGTQEPTVAIGIGINVDWDPVDFPPDLAPTMTSLRAEAAGRPVDREALLEGFLDRLEARVEALRSGRFPVDDWGTRQLTTGRLVRLEGHGPAPEEVLAVGVDTRTGALLVADPTWPGNERPVHAGEVTRVRLVGDPAPSSEAAAAPTTGPAPGPASPPAAV